jgi:hypothetical protein
MEVPAHLAILQAAVGAPGLLGRSTFSIIALTNAATDLDQATPGWHFDNAPDRAAVFARWREGVERPFRRIVQARQKAPEHNDGEERAGRATL